MEERGRQGRWRARKEGGLLGAITPAQQHPGPVSLAACVWDASHAAVLSGRAAGEGALTPSSESRFFADGYSCVLSTPFLSHQRNLSNLSGSWDHRFSLIFSVILNIKERLHFPLLWNHVSYTPLPTPAFLSFFWRTLEPLYLSPQTPWKATEEIYSRRVTFLCPEIKPFWSGREAVEAA